MANSHSGANFRGVKLSISTQIGSQETRDMGLRRAAQLAVQL